MFLINYDSRAREGSYSITLDSEEKCKAYLKDELKLSNPDYEEGGYEEILEDIELFNIPLKVEVSNAVSIRVSKLEG